MEHVLIRTSTGFKRAATGCIRISQNDEDSFADFGTTIIDAVEIALVWSKLHLECTPWG